MKKSITLCTLIAIAIIATSFIKFNNHNKPDDFPPIQKYFDKLEKTEFDVGQVIVSQKLNKKTFKLAINRSGYILKENYENINWEEFNRVYFKNIENNVTECEFQFFEEMKLTRIYSEDNNERIQQTDNFTCYIFTKDKDEVEKIIKEFLDTLEQ